MRYNIKEHDNVTIRSKISVINIYYKVFQVVSIKNNNNHHQEITELNV